MAPTNWICIKCGITNPKNFLKCQTCQEPKPIFWECTGCRRKNPTGLAKCAGCKRPRPAIYGETVAIKGMSKLKFASEANRSSLNDGGSEDSLSTSVLSSLAPVASSFQAVPGSTMSSIGPASSMLCGKYPSALTKSTLDYNVSYYDIFKKLSQPSRTTRHITYVDDDSKYKLINDSCCSKNTNFIDPQFPPTSRTLYYDSTTYKVMLDKDKAAKVYWLRHRHTKPIDHESQNLAWCVLRNPVVSDITQGVLGNCWLLTALAVMVERPNMLDKILAVKELSDRGVYRVRLYRDGKLISVVIDDYFPCNSRRYQIYSTAKRKQLFVSIIEKAMAKLYGCYESLVSGQVIEGLAALTGFPCRSIRIQGGSPATSKAEAPETQSSKSGGGRNADDPAFDPDFLWTMLLSYYTAGFLMGAACGGVSSISGTASLLSQTKDRVVQPLPAHATPGDDDEYTKMGLLNHHAYSIVSVVHVEGVDMRLIRLRNPWGTQVWKGDWSDESNCWTAELREQLKPQGANEGIFWMSFIDFQRYFEKVDICKMRDGWNEVRLEGYFPKDSKDHRFTCLFQLVVEEAGTEVELTLHQDSRRAVQIKDTPLMPIGVAVFQMQDLQWKIAGDFVDTSGYKMREFVGCDLMLDKGMYIIAVYAFNHWFKMGNEGTKKHQQPQPPSGRNLRPRYILSAHSSRFVEISAFCTSPAITGDSLIEIVLAEGRKKDHNENVTSYYVHENWAGLMVVIENRNKDAYLDVLFDANESTNLAATRGALQTQDTIPPMSRQLINILSQLDGNTSYYLSYQLSYRVSTQSVSVHSPDIDNVRALHSPRPFKQISEQQAKKPPSSMMGGIEQQLKAMIEQQKKAGQLGHPPKITTYVAKQPQQQTLAPPASAQSQGSMGPLSSSAGSISTPVTSTLNTSYSTASSPATCDAKSVQSGLVQTQPLQQKLQPRVQQCLQPPPGYPSKQNGSVSGTQIAQVNTTQQSQSSISQINRQQLQQRNQPSVVQMNQQQQSRMNRQEYEEALARLPPQQLAAYRQQQMLRAKAIQQGQQPPPPPPNKSMDNH